MIDTVFELATDSIDYRNSTAPIIEAKAIFSFKINGEPFLQNDNKKVLTCKNTLSTLQIKCKALESADKPIHAKLPKPLQAYAD